MPAAGNQTRQRNSERWERLQEEEEEKEKEKEEEEEVEEVAGGAQQPSRSGNQGSPNDCVSPCLIQFLKKEMVRQFGLLLIHLSFQSRWANFG